jgi:cytoskeletal protein CcmA (bactofilin family)
MTIVGDCETDGTVRVEGSVEGSIKAGKAVVVAKQGVVTGNIVTQDAVISGQVQGTLIATSRLELLGTAHVEGEIHTRRMQVEEGAVLNGVVHTCVDPPKVATVKPPAAAVRPPEMVPATPLPS